MIHSKAIRRLKMSEQMAQASVSNSLSSTKGFPEIRITLIGGRQLGGIESSGKSSVGNTILGRNAFDVKRRTARSVQVEGEVHGRHVTVVDTPGWWWHYSVENTPKFDRMEIIRCTTLCPPGPHTFLLVIPVDIFFPKVCRIALNEHLEFLSENVWRHIIVLFSCIAPNYDRSFKNNLRNWPDLQLILRRCQNRYHVLNIKDRNDSSQVITLLKKIEKMVAQNNHNYFKISKVLSIEDEREKIREEKVKQRILAVKSQRIQLQTRNKDQHLTDIQIVILGASWAARSSAGNLILGEEAFQVDESRTTVCCEVRHAEVHGRQLRVVDTPGWYYDRTLEKSSEIDKLEIRRSVHLCPPGPHAILLTVPIATAFNKAYRIAVEEHLGLLGKKVWSHLIVLFTRGDWLGDTTIEERFEKEGEHLEWLIEQCGYRYHVINCKNDTDSTQVTKLLEKIEEMVMENGHYEPDEKSNPLNELELKLKKAKINTEKGSRQKVILQELLKEREKQFSEVRIVLLGGEGVGKSKSGNVIVQEPFFDTTLSEGLKLQTRTRQCMMKKRKVEGCQVSVVDTPGWSTSNLENAKEILRSMTVSSPGPHAFLLVLPVSESFTKKAEQTVLELMSLFGEQVWRYTIIIFSGDWLKDRPVEQYIACEGEALQRLIRKCGNRYHVLHNDSDIKNLLKMIKEMVARNRGEYFTLEERKRTTTSVFQWFTGKVLTEEEWNKREDDLIERMLEAAVVDLDEESKQPSARRRGSFIGVIPSMSGDSLFDNTSLLGDTPNSAVSYAVYRWLSHPRNYAASSGYDSMSIRSDSQHPKMESINDGPMVKIHPSDTPKHVRNKREQKHARSSSI